METVLLPFVRSDLRFTGMTSLVKRSVPVPPETGREREAGGEVE